MDDTTTQEKQIRNWGVSLKKDTRIELDDFMTTKEPEIRQFKGLKYSRLLYDDTVKYLLYLAHQYEIEQATKNTSPEPVLFETTTGELIMETPAEPPLPQELQDLNTQYLHLLKDPSPDNVITVSKQIGAILTKINEIRAKNTQ